MSEHDPRHWAQWSSFDPEKGTMVREPPGEGPGYWVGAPGVTFHNKLERFYMPEREGGIIRVIQPDQQIGVICRVEHSFYGAQDLCQRFRIQFGGSTRTGR